MNCPLCLSANTQLAHRYTEPPAGENRFPQFEAQYQREFWRCQQCQHYFAQHDLDLQGLYEGDYGASLYDGDKMARSFNKINALPPAQSDNWGRVQFLKRYFHAAPPESVLDIGSGLGVFPYRLQDLGWNCTALDPDARACAHIQKWAQVPTLQGDFLKLEPTQRFDLLTLNKVLEHVPDSIGMLQRCHLWLNADGCVYVELPDGEAAAQDSLLREEFFIEHYHAFSAASFALLAQQAGFAVQHLERLQEPSSKYTLRAILTLSPMEKRSAP